MKCFVIECNRMYMNLSTKVFDKKQGAVYRRQASSSEFVSNKDMR